MKKITVEVIGEESQILNFVALCSKLEVMSVDTISGNIPLQFNAGDNGGLMFNIVSDVENKGKVDLIQSWMNHNRFSFEKELFDNDIKIHTI